ncbi:hypothetical protein [Azospirillum thiophilum]|nr:hypothetical protein [Azospirillum thiophilum]
MPWPSQALGVLGMTGFTAWWRLTAQRSGRRSSSASILARLSATVSER